MKEIQQSEYLLATLPGSNPADRLLVVLVHSKAGGSQSVKEIMVVPSPLQGWEARTSKTAGIANKRVRRA
jgi:hypothetical protein